ncbi:MAG: SoxR reducing system RseC family protein [Bacteroidales bacterium]|jgi:sigma-E factor negative regulatory protein RseC|nr:SoxR reducing system RseC family protein [Bacteroidales bacterium]
MNIGIGCTGSVVSVSENKVVVRINQDNACSGCRNKSACLTGRNNRLITVISKDASSFSVGEEVQLSMKESAGLKATFYAYIAPLVLLLICFGIMYHVTDSEILQIVPSLIAVAAYYLLLYKLRGRMEKTFRIVISKC